ncbi:MAG: response regulator [Saprospiraceae bacterium]|nr:response regulator [Saprospiraceae bacterium]
MDEIKVIIVEDEPLVAADLKNQLEKTNIKVTGIFESGEDALEGLKKDQPDIILLDVRLYGSMDGIETAEEINKSYDIPVLFLTANTDPATFERAKLTFPHAFLSKPFRIKDVLHSIELALGFQEEVSEKGEEFAAKYLADRVFIKTHTYLEKVMYDQILFIEADRAYTKVVTRDRTFTLSQTLKKIESRIQVPYLLRVHRSYIINTRNVDRIAEGYVYIGKHKIPVSRSNRDDLLSAFNTM